MWGVHEIAMLKGLKCQVKKGQIYKLVDQLFSLDVYLFNLKGLKWLICLKV